MCLAMSKKYKSYSQEDKLSLLRDYYQSGLSKKSFCKSRGIASVWSLNTWLKVFANEKDLLSLQSEQANITDMANRSKESYQEENAHLKQRIKNLEKALAFSKLETEARDLMITRAEEYFDIPIRKKNLGPSSHGTGRAAQYESCDCLPSIWPLPSSLLPVEG